MILKNHFEKAPSFFSIPGHIKMKGIAKEIQNENSFLT